MTESPAVDGYPAYVEFTVRMNVESGWEFDQLRHDISRAAQRMSTVRLIGDEAAVQVLHRKRHGARPIASDPQEPPPFSFERETGTGRGREQPPPPPASSSGTGNSEVRS